jgi:hypothetical protein
MHTVSCRLRPFVEYMVLLQLGFLSVANIYRATNNTKNQKPRRLDFLPSRDSSRYPYDMGDRSAL